MNARRFSACALLVLAALAAAVLTASHAIPALAGVSAVAALPGKWRAPFTRRQAVWGLGVLSAVLALLYGMGVHTARTPILMEMDMVHLLVDFCLLLQLSLLWSVPRGEEKSPVPYPALYLLLGVVALAGMGAVRASPAVQPTYQYFAMAYVFGALLFAASGDEQRPRMRQGRMRRMAVHGVLLALAFGSAAAATQWTARHGTQIDQYLIGFLSPLQRSTPGFSRSASLESVTRLRHQDQKTMLRIYSEAPPGYLRARAFDTYLNGHWNLAFPRETRTTTALAPPARAGVFTRQSLSLAPGAAEASSTHTIWHDPSLWDTFFLPQDTVELVASFSSATVDAHGVPAPEHLDTTEPVRARTMPRTPAMPPTPELREVMLQVPDTLDPRAHALAEELTAGLPNTEAKIAAVQAHFLNNYSYSFGIVLPPATEPLNYFLLEQPAAHCEYFAAGAVMLLRLAGIPARYVTGFVALDYNALGGYWLARNLDAHAWAEAYDEERGWVLVEATPPDGVPDAAGQGWWAGLRDYAGQRWREFRAWWRAAALLPVRETLLRVLFSPPVVLVLILALAFAAIRLYRRLRRGRTPDRRSPELRALGKLLREQDAALRRHGLRRDASETLHAFATRIEREETAPKGAAAWYRAYAHLRYHGPVSESAVEALRGGLR